VLPWVERLGYPLPCLFDFRVDGVTSISADLHKYGFAAKGAAVILYKNAEIRRYQYYGYTEWPGGLYISPTTLGTRAGAPLAAAYAAIVALGEEGFLELTKQEMETAVTLKNAISLIPELVLLGDPCMTILSFAARNPKHLNVFCVADVMEQMGWKIERNQKPDSIHCTLMPQHSKVCHKFVADLKAAVAEVTTNPEKHVKQGSAAMYGMVAQISDATVVEEFLYAFLDHIYRK